MFHYQIIIIIIYFFLLRLYGRAVKNRKKSSDKMQVNEIGSGEPHLLEICILTDFLLDIIPIETYTENTMNILPNLFKCIILSMKKNMPLLEHYEITVSLDLCTKILQKIQPVTVKQPSKAETEVSKSDMDKISEQAESIQDLDVSKEIRTGLEKSKSDSKINENINRNELTIENTSRERSNSNQMLVKKKERNSPKIDKKSRNKKSKSSSKLYDIKKGESAEQVETDSSEKLDIKEPLEVAQVSTIKTEIEHIIKCLEIYKSFYSVFLQSKILKSVNIETSYQNLMNDKEERTKNLEILLKRSLNLDSLAQCAENAAKNQMMQKYSSDLLSPSAFFKTMSVASNILLEFSTFSNILRENANDNLPQWLKVMLVCACSLTAPVDVRITAMNTLLDLFSLAKSQVVHKKVEDKVNVVMMGILNIAHVDFIEGSTTVLEVRYFFSLKQLISHVRAYFFIRRLCRKRCGICSEF